MIHISKDKRTFHIQGRDMSYILGILETGHVAQLYFGARLHAGKRW